MGEYWRVNSADTLSGFLKKAAALVEENKQVKFSWVVGKDRTATQNNMTFEIYTTIGKQLNGGDTDHARNECKLTVGVPILREESEDFRKSYDKLIKPLPYEDKIEAMNLISVSRTMTTKQCSRYIDNLLDVYTQKGVDFSYLNQRDF
tara:strand:- start:991 stop:1434 length:444 start_codon:yes stop_codon:yes gene_type:complete